MGSEWAYVGRRVTWRHELRGGYGYIERVDGEIVKVTSKERVTIRVLKKGVPTNVNVKLSKLDVRPSL